MSPAPANENVTLRPKARLTLDGNGFVLKLCDGRVEVVVSKREWLELREAVDKATRGRL